MKKINVLKTIAIVLLTGFSTMSSFAQSRRYSPSQENVAKLGIVGIFFGNVNLNYERVLSEGQSVALNLGILIPRKLPAVFVGAPTDPTLEIKNRLAGFSIIPEYRFYTAGDAPRGFYVAPYLRLSNYSVKFSETYNNKEASVTGAIFTIGGGLQLGVQWLIDDVVSIDWYFFGFGANRHTLSLKFKSDEIGINYAQWETDIYDEISTLPILGSKIKTESGADYVKAKAPFVFPGFRSGISIGIAF